MLCRGYNGRYPYAELTSPKPTDWLLGLILLILALSILIMDKLPL